MLAPLIQPCRVARAALALLAAALCAGSASAQARDETLSTRPAELRDLLRPDAREQAALSAVSDGGPTWRGPALYLLLDRADRLADAAGDRDLDLDRPAYASLLEGPARYRGRPVRLRLRVYRVLEMTPETNLGFSREWPRGRTVWRMFCTTVGEAAEQEPLVLCSVRQPRAAGIPWSRADDGEALYGDGPVVDAACLFYKTYEDREAEGGSLREYPLLIAWRLEPVSAAGAGGWWGPVARLGATLALLVTAGGIYLALKRRARASSLLQRSSLGHGREEEPPVEQDEQAEIDPQLRQAVEEYRQERQEGHGTDRSG